MVKEGLVDPSAKKVKRAEPWADREELSNRQWRSQAAFESLGDARRTAAILAVGDQLVELLGSLNDWVPRAINLNGEQSLEVTFQVQLPALKDIEVDVVVKTATEAAEAVAELREFASQMVPK